MTDPDGARWEWYVKTGDAEQMAPGTNETDTAVCCAPASDVPVTLGSCG